MITDEYLEKEKPHRLGGVQRIYKFPNGWGLSAVNAQRIFVYPFAWEISVLNSEGHLDYSTELTDDVEVFGTDEETNKFILRAAKEIGGAK